jgi:hypothetical protein
MYYIQGVEFAVRSPLVRVLSPRLSHTTLPVAARSGMKTFVRNGVFATSSLVAKMKQLSIL